MNKADYERRELEMLRVQLDRIERAPIQERREARRDFREAILDPALMGERCGWLLEGCYGWGAAHQAAQIQANPRMNRRAALCQLIAALDWQCPGNFARQVYRELPSDKQAEVDAAIDAALTTTPAVTV